MGGEVPLRRASVNPESPRRTISPRSTHNVREARGRPPRARRIADGIGSICGRRAETSSPSADETGLEEALAERGVAQSGPCATAGLRAVTHSNIGRRRHSAALVIRRCSVPTPERLRNRSIADRVRAEDKALRQFAAASRDGAAHWGGRRAPPTSRPGSRANPPDTQYRVARSRDRAPPPTSMQIRDAGSSTRGHARTKDVEERVTAVDRRSSRMNRTQRETRRLVDDAPLRAGTRPRRSDRARWCCPRARAVPLPNLVVALSGS